MQIKPLLQPITLQPHLSIEELQTRSHKAKSPVERSQFQIIWLIGQGKSLEEVATLTGYNQHWIYQLIWRYNQFGVEEIKKRKYENSGLFFCLFKCVVLT